MQKKFLSSLGLIILLNIIVKPLYILGIDAEVQNRVGQEGYGLYFGLLNLTFIFNILIDLGINNFNNRNIAQNADLIKDHFSKLFSAKAVLAFFYAIITLLLGLLLGYFQNQHDLSLLLFLVLNQVIVSFILFSRSNLAGLHLFKSDSIVSVLDRTLLIIFCSILLFTGIAGQDFKIEWFVYLQTLAYGLTLLISLFMLRGEIGRLKWDLDTKFNKEIFRKSLPFALFILSAALYNRVDGVMLENMIDDESATAGVYAQGFRFYEAAGMFSFLFGTLLLPIYSRMLKRNEKVEGVLRLSANLLISISIFAAILCFFFGDEILHWRYVDVTPEAEDAFTALMFAFVGMSMFYIYGTLLTANANLRILNIISFTGLGLNLVANFALIPNYGAVGAALATMITQLFAGMAQFVVVKRKFSLDIQSMVLVRLGIFIAFYSLINYYLGKTQLEGINLVLISGLCGLALLFVTGSIQIRQITEILRLKDE
jgi:O-antigen/teichoic acid export membrane protein